MNGFQTFDVRGGECNIGAAGNFIRFDSTSGKPIRIRGDGQDLGQLWPDEDMELPEGVRSWTIVADATETGQVRIGFGRIDSTRQVIAKKPPVLAMAAGGVAVAAGGSVAGWVSGNPANLAAGATVDVIFDLGPDWDQYGLFGILMSSKAPATQYTSVQISSGPAPVYDDTLRVNYANSTGLNAAYITSATTANGAMEGLFRSKGRYVGVRFQNEATNPQGAGASCKLSAWPN